MDENFNLLSRGSVILVWSPSGARTRWVVQRKQWCGYDVIEIDEQDNLIIGANFITPAEIEEQEAFGYTYTYMLGEAIKLPDFL